MIKRARAVIEEKDFARGLLYIAISRVKALERLLFKGSFDLERFYIAVLLLICDQVLDQRLRGN